MPKSNFEKQNWFRLPLSEQLGNIGSEVARALSWRQKNAREHSEKAVERANATELDRYFMQFALAARLHK